jgi:hypothetical protein
MMANHVAGPGIGNRHGRSNNVAKGIIIATEASIWKVAVPSGAELGGSRRATSAASP